MASEENKEIHDKDEIKERIQKYQKEIKVNSTNYEANVNLITALRDLYLLNNDQEGKLNLNGSENVSAVNEANITFMKLRNARKRMNYIYPLSVELWLDWINDELNLEPNKIDDKLILDIFSRATEDYISVKVWCLYAKYKIEKMDYCDSVTENDVRDLFENAIMNVGLHFSDGGEIWDEYIKFEQSLLDKMNGDPTEENYKRQLSRVAKLLQRKLSVPLLNHNEHYRDVCKFLNSNDVAKNFISEDTMKKLHLVTSATVDQIQPMELSLQDTSDKVLLLKHYYTYLASELDKSSKSSFDPARIQCIFERAVRDFCLDSQLWLEYINFLKEVIKLPDLVVKCCRRALRNITWDANLVIKCAHTIESVHKPASVINSIYEEALQKKYFTAADICKLWIAKISFERRAITKDSGIQDEKVKSTIRSLLSQALMSFESLENVDLALVEFITFWTEVEGNWFQEAEKMKQIWKYACQAYTNYTILTSGIHFARSVNDVQLTRFFFNIAVNQDRENLETHCENWIKFENINGSLDSLDEIFEILRLGKTDNKLPSYKKKRKYTMVPQLLTGAKLSKVKSSLLFPPVFVHDERKRKVHNDGLKNEDESRKKIKREETVDTSPVIGPQILPKDTVMIGPQIPPEFGAKVEPMDEDEDSDETEDEMNSDEGRETQVIGPQIPQGFLKNETNDSNKISKNKSNKDTNNSTVYVSNLHPAVTEKDLKDMFSVAGTVQDIKLHKFSGGKVFAFIEFSTADEAKDAFKLEHTPLHNRPVYVTEFQKGNNRHAKAHPTGSSRYTQELEKTKLYVSNLPKMIRQTDLEPLFNRHNDMKSLRLVTRKGPNQRVFAYVEYSTEEQAARSLTETDGRFLKGLTIQVKYSNPSRQETPNLPRVHDAHPFKESKPPQKSFATPFVPFQAQNPRKPIAQGPTQRLQFVPASVKLSNRNSNEKPMETETNSQETQPQTSLSAMSNNDFRKMFVKSSTGK